MAERPALRIAAMVSVDSIGGSLILAFHPLIGIELADSVHAGLSLSLWREDSDTIRMRFQHSPSGASAYLQGGSGLLTLAEEIGLKAKR